MKLTDVFPIGRSLIEVALADITKADTDAIVNSVCDRIHIGIGVSGAILRAGGPNAIPKRTDFDQILPGQVLVTPAGSLAHKHVFHAISSKCEQGTTREILEDCARNALRLVRERQLKSIAFPALGTGEMLFDTHEAAKILINTVVRDCNEDKGIERILFCLFRPSAFTTFFREAVKASIQEEERISTRRQNPNHKTALEEIMLIWKEKLLFFRKEEALAVDPEMKFNIKKRIEGINAKLSEIRTEFLLFEACTALTLRRPSWGQA